MIAIDIIWQILLNEGLEHAAIDVFDIVATLRTQRQAMVQTNVRRFADTTFVLNEGAWFWSGAHALFRFLFLFFFRPPPFSSPLCRTNSCSVIKQRWR